MICYKCDMCGDLHYDIGEMNNVKIYYAGNAHVTYPNNGDFIVCNKCKTTLINMLMQTKNNIDKEKENKQ